MPSKSESGKLSSIDHAAPSDDVRMTVGEHLEELRYRLVRALMGLAILLVACLVYGKEVTAYFCKPLIDVLRAHDLTPTIYSTEVADGFMVFVRISLICAVSLASPWMLYQLWQFVAAGLYPGERKWVARFAPLSIALLVTGMVFVYFLVLPWTLDFFIGFTTDYKVTAQPPHIATTWPTSMPHMAVLDGDPRSPADGTYWLNTHDGKAKMAINGQTRVIALISENLIAPIYTLPQYIALVVSMLLTFGIAFQLPLALLASVKLGLTDVAFLRKSRKIALLVMTVVAAVITPGDALTSTVALLLPLALLYEFGILLAVWATPNTSPGGFDVP